MIDVTFVPCRAHASAGFAVQVLTLQPKVGFAAPVQVHAALTAVHCVSSVQQVDVSVAHWHAFVEAHWPTGRPVKVHVQAEFVALQALSLEQQTSGWLCVPGSSRSAKSVMVEQRAPGVVPLQVSFSWTRLVELH